MYATILQQAGLSSEDSKVYEALLLSGTLTVAELYRKVKPIKRTTLYQVLRRLAERGLVSESKKGAKAGFSAAPPDTLLVLLEQESALLEKRRTLLTSSLKEMREKYVLAGERPVLRYHEGIEGLKEIYEGHLLSADKELRFVRAGRANMNSDTFGNWWAHYVRRRKERGVKSLAITPDDAEANHDEALDKERGLSRTWVRMSDYNAPVEIDVFGNTVAIISFGKEMFGVTLENEHIAKAFKDIFDLANKGAKTIEVKHAHS